MKCSVSYKNQEKSPKETKRCQKTKTEGVVQSGEQRALEL